LPIQDSARLSRLLELRLGPITHRPGVQEAYAQLSQRKVAEGDRIGCVAVVGALVDTGRSSGPHGHDQVLCQDAAIHPTRLFAVLQKYYFSSEIPDVL